MKTELISSLSKWGDSILKDRNKMEFPMLKSRRDNKWFDLDQQWKAIKAICRNYLNEKHLAKWLNAYEIKYHKPLNIGLICAGNIPLVGFHDVLSILVSGHRGKVKLSSKDAHMLPAMLDILHGIHPELAARIEFVEKLKDYDAIIATGSDNSARYFYEYFSHVPHLIRKNRQGVAIISEKISDVELQALKEDVFTYYGLGCRNVSMIMLPQMFNKERLYAALRADKTIRENDKYNNNYQYNLAVCMLENREFRTNEDLLFIENDDLHSRLASIHLKSYKTIDEVYVFLAENKDKIQCIVADEAMKLEAKTILPGQSHSPQLWDYADGVDTLNFLKKLRGNPINIE